MQKDRNRPEYYSTDHSLPRSVILRGRRNFQRLFEKSTILNSNSLQLRYRIYKDPAEGCYIGFIAPKKVIRSAVKRNKTKRLLKEVYRTQQEPLRQIFSEKRFGFHGAFIANRENLTFTDIQKEMIPLLGQARENLQKVAFSAPPSTGKHKKN
ncbi:MAG: ribonuclease P protein component [Balneolaceae bacterium]